MKPTTSTKKVKRHTPVAGIEFFAATALVEGLQINFPFLTITKTPCSANPELFVIEYEVDEAIYNLHAGRISGFCQAYTFLAGRGKLK